MFTTNHFIWMALCVVLIVVLLVVSIKFKFTFKTATIIICCIIGASEFAKIMYSMKPATDSGMVISAGALPFHLCSVLIFIFAYLLVGKNEKILNALKSFVVPAGILGGLLAILIPTSGVGFNQIQAYQCFIYHSSILWYAAYLIVTKQADLGLKAYLRNMGILALLAVFNIWVNGALQAYNTNFMFLVRPPVEGLPIINLNNGWYAYFFTLIVIAIVLIGLVHLPSIIIEIKNKHKLKKETMADDNVAEPVIDGNVAKTLKGASTTKTASNTSSKTKTKKD